jgi:hypothetical protein
MGEGMSLLAKKLAHLKEKGQSLGEILAKIMPCLEKEFENVAWNSLNIDYHPPKVERLWAQFDSMRLMIHRIHDTDPGEALFHPHPWPSAVYVVQGDEYRMGFGSGSSEVTPPVSGTVILSPGSSYEMLDKNAWHYVAPQKGGSISIMLSGIPWKEPHPFYTAGDKKKLHPLTEKARANLIWGFKNGMQTLRESGRLR